jgi:hypothetical protein
MATRNPKTAFSPTLSAPVAVGAGSSVPYTATAIGIPVAAIGLAPAELSVGRKRLEAAGFDGKVRSTLVVP